MSHTTRLAVAMGSTLKFNHCTNVPNLQAAYEIVSGGGCVEIYQDIADLAMVAGTLLDEIQKTDAIEWPGCFDYEVAEPVAEEWQRLVMAGAEEQGQGMYASPANAKEYLGRLTLEFFTQRGANADYTLHLARVVKNFTGYEAAE